MSLYKKRVFRHSLAQGTCRDIFAVGFSFEMTVPNNYNEKGEGNAGKEFGIGIGK